eukprot:1896699-Prymnesium_polylepis.1
MYPRACSTCKRNSEVKKKSVGASDARDLPLSSGGAMAVHTSFGVHKREGLPSALPCPEPATRLVELAVLRKVPVVPVMVDGVRAWSARINATPVHIDSVAKGECDADQGPARAPQTESSRLSDPPVIVGNRLTQLALDTGPVPLRS